jgi:type II secretory pathway component PulL
VRVCLIDIQDEHLDLYVAERNGDDVRMMDTDSIPFKGSLEQALKGLSGRCGAHIYLSLPLSMLSLRELDFPFSDRKKIEETIRYEIDDLLLGSADEYIIDHLIMQGSGDRCRVLAVCIEKKRLGEMINTFSSAGIEPRVITSLDVRLIGDGGMESPLSITGLQGMDIKRRREVVVKELQRPSINLRKGEFQYTGNIEDIAKKLRLTTILLILILLAFSTGNLKSLLQIKDENSILSRKTYEIYRNAFPADKRVIDPVRQFRGKVNQMMKKREVFGSRSVIDTLKEISGIIGMPGVSREIRLREFRSGQEGILIKGTAGTFEDVEALRNRLSSHYEDVKVLDSSLSPDSRVDFTIMMKETET